MPNVGWMKLYCSVHHVVSTTSNLTTLNFCENMQYTYFSREGT